MVLKRLLCCATDPVVEQAPIPVYQDEPELPAPLNLSQFTLKRVVGKGTYARVRVIERTAHPKGTLYALKQIEKAHCGLHNAKSVVNERMILEEVAHHPFIIHLSWAFQDETFCYLVLNFMPGGDLRFHLVRRGSLGENSVRFYVAEISSALAYLHQMGICHRDVKPENVLLDLHGHVRLTDFNVAMRFSETRLHTEVAGTMMYMSPEMVLRVGYSWQVDYWSLGILAHECLFGNRPFAAGCTDARIVKDAIVRLPLLFPVKAQRICSPEGVEAIRMLLNRDSTKRLGCQAWSRRQGKSQLRGDPWFRGMDWERLDTRRLPAPFIPERDVWNFEEDDEPAWVYEAQLRRHINRLSHMSHMSEKSTAEQRYLEEHFTPYDMDKNPRPMFMGPPPNEPTLPESHPARSKRRPRFSLKSGEEAKRLL